MDIKDVKVGDRCWVAGGKDCDEQGQNATVSRVDKLGLVASVDGTSYNFYRVPGETAFWRKPEAPPKPKRKVKRTGTGYVDPEWLRKVADDNRLGQWYTAALHSSCISDKTGLVPVTFSWEVEE